MKISRHPSIVALNILGLTNQQQLIQEVMGEIKDFSERNKQIEHFDELTTSSAILKRRLSSNTSLVTGLCIRRYKLPLQQEEQKNSNTVNTY